MESWYAMVTDEEKRITQKGTDRKDWEDITTSHNNCNHSDVVVQMLKVGRLEVSLLLVKLKMKCIYLLRVS